MATSTASMANALKTRSDNKPKKPFNKHQSRVSITRRYFGVSASQRYETRATRTTSDGPQSVTLSVDGGSKYSGRCENGSMKIMMLPSMSGRSVVTAAARAAPPDSVDKQGPERTRPRPPSDGRLISLGQLVAPVTVVSLLLLQLHVAQARPSYYQNQHFGPIPGGRQLPLDDFGRLSLAGRGTQTAQVAEEPPMSYEQFGLDEDAPMGLRHGQQGGSRGPPSAQRRDDLDDDLEDDDDGDQSAAASYQNQDNEGGPSVAGTQDGYGENDPEPDAAYEETPNEQEGQADLERFFDDHLGASDREGMDKENLPTNQVSAHAEPTDGAEVLSEAPTMLMAATRAVPLATVTNPVVKQAPAPMQHELIQSAEQPTVETTSYIKLPDKNKLIITHQVIRKRGPSESGSARPVAPLRDLSQNVAVNAGADQFEPHQLQQQQDKQQDEIKYGWEKEQHLQPSGGWERVDNKGDDGHEIGATASDIQLTEDDNFDQVFVTTATNKPFKIDALGGYDPEQDFQEAAAEIDGANGAPARRAALRRANTEVTSGHRSDESDSEPDEDETSTRLAKAAMEPASAGPGGQTDKLGARSADVPFSDDPETETLFDEASETDEITFGQDDPYQTDLEAEMRQQEFDRVGQFLSSTNPSYATDRNSPERVFEPVASELSHGSNAPGAGGPRHTGRASRPGRLESDSDEGSWVNDGVEDMDIPSQSHQNMILEKAAKQEEAARRAAADEASDGSSVAVDSPEIEPASAPASLDQEGQKGQASKEGTVKSTKRTLELDGAKFNEDDLEDDDNENDASTIQIAKNRSRFSGKAMASPTNARPIESDDQYEGQRMPNANYLQNDVTEADEDSGD